MKLIEEKFRLRKDFFKKTPNFFLPISDKKATFQLTAVYNLMEKSKPIKELKWSEIKETPFFKLVKNNERKIF